MENLYKLNAKLKLIGQVRRLRGAAWTPNVVYHVCYHRCMTLLFTRLLSYCSNIFSVPFEVNPSLSLVESEGIYLNNQGNASIPEDLSLRGSHIIRDPRDLIVSAYFYHLRTTESWCITPKAEHTDLPSNVSYQQHLRSLDIEEGLIYEMNHVSGSMIERMCSWDYSDGRFLNLRFENVIGNEVSTIQKVLIWYGLDETHAKEVSQYLKFLGYHQLRRSTKNPLTNSAHTPSTKSLHYREAA
jgi:hypothetical protein